MLNLAVNPTIRPVELATLTKLKKGGFGSCIVTEKKEGGLKIQSPCPGALLVDCTGHLDPGASLLTCGKQKKILSPETASSCPYRQKTET